MNCFADDDPRLEQVEKFYSEYLDSVWFHDADKDEAEKIYNQKVLSLLTAEEILEAF